MVSTVSVGEKSIVPVCEKAYLTLQEASEYFNIGCAKLRELTDTDNSQLVLWNGRKRLIKRKRMESYLDEVYSI